MGRRLLVTVFEREEEFLGASTLARAEGVTIADAYAPYLVHGLDRALGLRPSRLPWICFALGLAGAALMLLFEFWATAIDWPLNVGGRPWNSLPAFVPVTFEVMVLFAGVGTVAAFFAVAGLHPWRRAQAPDPRVTDDRFALVLAPNDSAHRSAVAAMLSRFRPVRIEERIEETT